MQVFPVRTLYDVHLPHVKVEAAVFQVVADVVVAAASDAYL